MPVTPTNAPGTERIGSPTPANPIHPVSAPSSFSSPVGNAPPPPRKKLRFCAPSGTAGTAAATARAKSECSIRFIGLLPCAVTQPRVSQSPARRANRIAILACPAREIRATAFLTARRRRTAGSAHSILGTHAGIGEIETYVEISGVCRSGFRHLQQKRITRLPEDSVGFVSPVARTF
jgi:hypothetical protein